MLQANELMIGDWVSYGGTSIKVENVYKDCINFQHDIPYVQEEFLIEETEIEPIPLTAEILEKNWFAEWRDKCYRWEYAEGIYIDIDFTEEEPWVHISNRCYSATPVCRYVHELKHAMRLCGIEKEIVI